MEVGSGNNGNSEVGMRKSEVENWNREVGRRKLEFGRGISEGGHRQAQASQSRNAEVGILKWEVGMWKSEVGKLEFGGGKVEGGKRRRWEDEKVGEGSTLRGMMTHGAGRLG